MTGPARIHILTSVSLFFSVLGLRAQDEAKSPTIFAVWSADSQVPAICCGRPEWFVSVVPEEIDISEVKKASLVRGYSKVEAAVIYADPSRRLCVLEVAEGSLEGSPVPLTSNPFPRAGLALHCSYSDASCRSMVTGKDFFYRGEVLPIPYLRIRLADSEDLCRIGAPLFNEHGEVVGLVSERDLELENEVHAIPATQIRKVILDLERFSETAPSWVGLIFHNESSTPVVLEVKPDSPASESGFEPGDVVITLNGAEIEELIDLCDAPFNLPAGVPAKVGVLRGLEKVTLEVVPTFAQTAAAN